MLHVPQGSAYKSERASELLLLVQQAHEEFDRSQSDPDWNWDTDTGEIHVQGKSYNVLRRFGFAEYFFTLRAILNTEVANLGGAGRDRVPFGFVAYAESTHDIYIVFRGTMTPAEWITNFQFKPGSDPFLR